MKKVALILLIINSLNLIAQDVILNESFKRKEFSKILMHNTWANSKGRPDANFTFTNVGHEDNSCLKVYIRKNVIQGEGSQASIDLFDISLVKNKTYKLTFYIKTRTPDDRIDFVIYSSAKTGSKLSKFTPLHQQKIKFKGNGSWSKQEITFKAVKKNKAGKPIDLKNLGIGLGFNTRRGVFYIDDIKLVEVN